MHQLSRELRVPLGEAVDGAIVEDVGADRGVMLAEGGFQSGAVQATRTSNVVVTSLANLRAEAAQALTQRRLLALPERIASAYARYWAIPSAVEGCASAPPMLSKMDKAQIAPAGWLCFIFNTFTSRTRKKPD